MLVRRLLAFLIDYVLITIYALLLLSVAIGIYGFDTLLHMKPDPIKGYLIGFFMLTLPVLCYGYFMESSHYKATIGKQCMKISVISLQGNIGLLERNILKFLPWEISHIGVHGLRFYIDTGAEIPFWIWVLLIFPQIVVIVYLFTVLYYQGIYSLYDKFAKTKISL
ncbi:MAG: RDD family protein [Thermonemataceae bacterium]|nr:RDD family protein [Thermonemataceae bacterium]